MTGISEPAGYQRKESLAYRPALNAKEAWSNAMRIMTIPRMASRAGRRAAEVDFTLGFSLFDIPFFTDCSQYGTVPFSRKGKENYPGRHGQSAIDLIAVYLVQQPLPGQAQYASRLGAIPIR